MIASSPLQTPTAVPVATPDALRAQLRRRGQLKGRQPDDASRAEVRSLIGNGPHRRDRLIEHLHALNDAHRGLWERHLVALAAEMRLSMAEVFEVASFYHHFEVLREGDTPAALTVRVCDGLSCAMAGSQALLANLPAILGRDVRVIPAPCVGRCEQAPVAVVGQSPVLLADVASVQNACASGVTTHPAARDDGAFDPAAVAPCVITASPQDVAPSYVGYAAYRAQGGYALATAVQADAQITETVLKAMEDSGLRGLGGAGFPAGRKWRIVREQPAPRLMAVNIDEGEPGTFKDRTYLERDPHRFLEGLLVAAQVVGIEAVYIYLRDEYHGARAILSTELERLQAEPPFPLPRIELRRGAGAYICGEESAMIESIEGKRGEPRLRPPYIAQVGLFGRPTLEHNFETLYWVRDIVQRGPAWFSGLGRNGRTGLRSFSVSGRVQQPGVKLAPAGITLRELVDEYCGGMVEGHTLYAYLPGGASGGILPASLADAPLDFDTLQPHGSFIGSAAVVVLSEADSARDAALNAMRFFAHESCGQCTPCRVGTEKASALMAQPGDWDALTLEDLAVVMTDASICGLGQAAPNPMRCVLKYFPHEVQAAGAKAST
ncbi:MAG: NADH-ubiquinone oxidoreductase-F iron-sulfur binding region domain-containing protein [Hydrogenophaga sp.]|uniref:NADH-ubiquinone oxidoreductase-F iron-sulfur binding region domain-containing protein n=1 Tax=Hydrogenophaga sp. TaxID=1904254 RepID=UPI0027263D76|nr:NADH-ubiquinone oxidoreductase-F iron-sulfur binding region domain-containing protein [Hydrogenophaga sp.]MDO9030909.1 NADH-ubiquinone oxidoreductase-F iron-sulfur binding region domain-containing protein [Hydrogenophaga sp.]